MARRGENIFKRKDGRWEARYIKGRDLSGKAIYGYVYARSYREVKQKQIDRVTHLNKPKHHQDVLFLRLLTNWLEQHKLHVKESTYQTYKRHINNHILPEIGDYKVKKINKQSIQNYANKKLKNGRLDGKGGLSSKTVLELVNIIKLCMKYYSEMNAIEYKDLNVKIRKNYKTIDVLSNKEHEKILKSIDVNDLGVAVILSLYCGLRIGEICALRWEDINLHNKEIYVHKTLYRIPTDDNQQKTKIVIASTKSKTSTRIIPMPECVITVLRKQTVSHGFLLNKNGSPYEPRTLSYQLKRLLKRNNLRDISFHTLRHTFASRCIELGFDYNALSEILGHSKASTTMNIYVHTNAINKKRYMNRLTFNLSQ